MSEEYNTSGIIAVSALDFKFLNKFKENTHNAGSMNMSFHIKKNAFSLYLSNSITTDHAQF
jgi:hypothetical protein